MLIVFFKSKVATGVVVGVVVGVVGVVGVAGVVGVVGVVGEVGAVGPVVIPVTELEIALANAVTTAWLALLASVAVAPLLIEVEA